MKQRPNVIEKQSCPWFGVTAQTSTKRSWAHWTHTHTHTANRRRISILIYETADIIIIKIFSFDRNYTKWREKKSHTQQSHNLMSIEYVNNDDYLIWCGNCIASHTHRETERVTHKCCFVTIWWLFFYNCFFNIIFIFFLCVIFIFKAVQSFLFVS